MALSTIIVHVTESLNRGGAEVLLVEYINSLPRNIINIVVYLGRPITIINELENVSEIICLNYYKKKDLLRASLQLREIVKSRRASLVHSHLYWPTIISRLAATNTVPLIFSVHNPMTQDAFNPNILSKYLEKASYSKRQTAVFVSRAAYDDYRQHINVSGRAAVIYNFVGDAFFSEAAAKLTFTGSGLRLVAVGNLKPQKNHLFLLQCMKLLSKYNITLDIYGEGAQREPLERYIEEQQISKVRLMGSEAHLEHKLNTYDVFVLASRYEGFCIAMAEAMATGLPCVVPDLEVLKEVSGERQLYFEQNNEYDFIDKLLLLYNNERLLNTYSAAAKEVAEKYTKAAHVQQLLQLYEAVLN